MADAPAGTPGGRMFKIKPQKKGLCFDGSEVEQFLDFYELAAQLDGVSEYNMARQLGCFVQEGKILTILATLQGYKPLDWPKLKAAMIAYWGDVDKALFTERDLDVLVDLWAAKGGVLSVSEYQAFHKSWEPIQSYLVLKKHIDSKEELRKKYYQKAMAANDVILKMEADRQPKETVDQSKTPATVDDLTPMLKSFKQRLKQELVAAPSTPNPSSGSRGPLVCYYCHCEGHGTARCFELKKDKDEKLVEQKGTNFFLPNGALIPFDSLCPIRHVVASYQPKTNVVETEFWTTCVTLDLCVRIQRLML
ncbi:hypothetical protein PTTG_28492 [Puccinia triticina 1-1 BBBD Race 1]|uniref:CCHC-type domain-containing protein n=1 Tax=Puccinia triticina (isolate 1-1 / race 1 (BBBD)) TaxID=630390 RepID=A0A180GB25_PUCT1|nr:hypothetical protein PTTG_28492 [Puccinia triticina 1-1 BBBD Race 1]